MESPLLHDWNEVQPLTADLTRPSRVELNDETLRDGLQSPSVRQPTIAEKEAFVRLLPALGIGSANIGYPGASEQAYGDVVRLARLIRDEHLPVSPNCAGRTHQADIMPMVRAQQETGVPIQAALFIGSSPIRQWVEGWTLERLLHTIDEAVGLATREGLEVMFVTEDTTRARPADIEAMYGAAADAGAKRFCVADTVGHATPSGTQRLVQFVKASLERRGVTPEIDWHGHRDRGLDVINSLAALAAGATRVHACAAGIGERVGNAAMDTVLVNLVMLGWLDQDLSTLAEYCRLAVEMTRSELPRNYPVMGEDAFATSTGVHAAAVAKAYQKGDQWLADRVYSSVPAALVGRRQAIKIGPMSGRSNAEFWLKDHGVEATPERLAAVLGLAKATDHVLTDAEILATIGQLQHSASV